MPYGPVRLLVVQPTPFCNLDCDYCYLPNRDDRSRLSLEILEAALERVLESPYFDGDFTLLWHAGEPLTVPMSACRWMGPPSCTTPTAAPAPVLAPMPPPCAASTG